MSKTAPEILTDLCDAVRGTGAFHSVTIGPDEDATAYPRAEVLLVSTDEARPDDTADTRWTTLQATIRIHVRSHEHADALERSLELAGLAQEAILTDRFRGQRCKHLPIGRATELGTAILVPRVKSPYLAVSFEVHCHFESDEAQ